VLSGVGGEKLTGFGKKRRTPILNQTGGTWNQKKGNRWPPVNRRCMYKKGKGEIGCVKEQSVGLNVDLSFERGSGGEAKKIKIQSGARESGDNWSAKDSNRGRKTSGVRFGTLRADREKRLRWEKMIGSPGSARARTKTC